MIRLMSIGCGGYLQEVILLGRLIHEGFTSIELTCVDILESEDKLSKLQTFFNEQFPQLDISLLRIQTVQNAGTQSKYDIVYAIDFDDLFAAYDENNFELHHCLDVYDETHGSNKTIDDFRSGLGDLILARNLLTTTGALFLGHGEQDIKISAGNELTLFTQAQFFHDHEAFQNPPTDSVHIVTNIYHPGTVFALLVLFLDKGCKSIQLTLEQRASYTMQSKMRINGEDIQRNYTFSTTAVEFMMKLFSQFSDKITVHLTEDIRPSIPNSHAAFLDTDLCMGNVSTYDGALHTVIMNK